jgi:hypothetical protein
LEHGNKVKRVSVVDRGEILEHTVGVIGLNVDTSGHKK